MKIILQTTDSQSKFARSAEVQVGYDDLNIHEVWEELIVPALLGYGFCQTVIDKIHEQ